MISYDAGRLSLRRIFGYLPTGLVWLIAASAVLAPAAPAEWLTSLSTSLGAVGVGLALVLLLFCVGAITTPINFSFAVMLGSLFDWTTQVIWPHVPAATRSWLEANEIVSPLTLGERRVQMRAWMTMHGAPTDLGPVSAGNVEWRVLKLLVMSRSPVFATEIVDLEAEANLYAGLALPLLILGWSQWGQQSWLSATLVVLSLVAPIRFQYARHRELDEIGNAYVAIFAAGAQGDPPSASVPQGQP